MDMYAHFEGGIPTTDSTTLVFLTTTLLLTYRRHKDHISNYMSIEQLVLVFINDKCCSADMTTDRVQAKNRLLQ